MAELLNYADIWKHVYIHTKFNVTLYIKIFCIGGKKETSNELTYHLTCSPISEDRTVSTVISNGLGMDIRRSPGNRRLFVIMPLPVSAGNVNISLKNLLTFQQRSQYPFWFLCNVNISLTTCKHFNKGPSIPSSFCVM